MTNVRHLEYREVLEESSEHLCAAAQPCAASTRARWDTGATTWSSCGAFWEGTNGEDQAFTTTKCASGPPWCPCAVPASFWTVEIGQDSGADQHRASLRKSIRPSVNDEERVQRAVGLWSCGTSACTPGDVAGGSRDGLARWPCCAIYFFIGTDEIRKTLPKIRKIQKYVRTHCCGAF